nr:hypothetical protein Iba_chr11bCG0280 [Ipomoea batatas]GME16742.1 hypothetical protein Iba_scaffold17844CG0560 [Ipomoea batatas]
MHSFYTDVKWFPDTLICRGAEEKIRPRRDLSGQPYSNFMWHWRYCLHSCIGTSSTREN